MLNPICSSSLGPISQRFAWCCNNGCGTCEAKLVEYRTYVEETNGQITQQRTEPRLVSACCGGGMFLWDTLADTEGPRGFEGSLANDNLPSSTASN